MNKVVTQLTTEADVSRRPDTEIERLARMLVANWDYSNKMQEAGADARAEGKSDYVFEECDKALTPLVRPLERLILSLPARSVADVAAQCAIASQWLKWAHEDLSVNPETGEPYDLAGAREYIEGLPLVFDVAARLLRISHCLGDGLTRLQEIYAGGGRGSILEDVGDALGGMTLLKVGLKSQ